MKTKKQKQKAIIGLKDEIKRLENMQNKDDFYKGLLLAYKENFKGVI